MERYWEVTIELPNYENRKMINTFLLNLKSKNRCEQTISRYRGILQQFYSLHEKIYHSVTRKEIHDWLSEQHAGRKERTVADYMKVLRAFYAYCEVENLIGKSPLRDHSVVVSSTERFWELKRTLPNQENQSVINRFLYTLKEAGRSEKTVVCKRVFLQSFFMDQNKTFDSITLDDIQQWFTVHQNEWNPKTIDGIRSALRTFYEFCWEEDLMDNPPLRNKRRFKEPSENYWEIQIRLPNEENKQTINEYLLHLKTRKRSKKTIEEYKIFLQLFFTCTERHFSLIERGDIDKWFTSRYKNDGANRTLENNLGILRLFYIYCSRKGYVETSPIQYKWDIRKAGEKYWEIRKLFANDDNKKVINEFLATMRLANMSANTIFQYKWFLTRFFQNREESFSTLPPVVIQEWLEHHQKKLAGETILTRLIILASFYKFCVDEDYMERTPIKRRWYPKKPQPVPKYLEKVEIVKVRQESEKEELRSRALLEFLLTSGCRISEVYLLDIEDVDLDNRTARVMGKGRKVREVHFSETSALLLERYLDARDDEHPALFVSGRDTRLSIRRMQELIEQMGKEAELIRSLHPHRLRHTFATELLTKGADLSFIADELGHSNLQTTKTYARLPKWKLVSLYRKYMG